MLTVGNNELEGKPKLGTEIVCKRCGEKHPVIYGEEILKDGTRVPTKSLAFYHCGGKTYLAGIDGIEFTGRG